MSLVATITLVVAAFVAFTVKQNENNAAGAGDVAPKSIRGAAGGSSRLRTSPGAAPHSDEARLSEPSKPPVDPRQLIETLAGFEPDTLTPENTEEWRRGLLELAEQGRAAVSALQEFFQKNVDRRFPADAANSLGEPTLRIALMKVLFELPTPDNVELQEKLLRSVNDPDEIAVLARQLHAQEPGKYRESIIRAVKAALVQAKNGQWPGRDTKGLTEILEYHGVPVPDPGP